MNMRNAVGFLSFGLVMGLLPVLAPAWFPPAGIDGSSARALWLEVMGAVQTALGAGWLLGPLAMRTTVRWLAPRPSPVAPMVPFESGDIAPSFDETLAREAA
jgi:hypothetical protein